MTCYLNKQCGVKVREWVTLVEIHVHWNSCGFKALPYSTANALLRHIRDVTRDRLFFRRIIIQRMCFAAIPYATCAFNGKSPEIRYLLRVTSHLISKLDREYEEQVARFPERSPSIILDCYLCIVKNTIVYCIALLQVITIFVYIIHFLRWKLYVQILQTWRGNFK